VNGGLTDDSHRLIIQVTDAETPANVARVEWAFRVRNLGSTPGGSGQLLRRSFGSQICMDCHDATAIQTHSSQATDSGYGNWAIDCLTCHTPHGTSNINLIREVIRTPNSGKRSVRFETKTGAVQDTANLAGVASYANEDAGTAGSPAAVDGPCQVCHTKTQSGGTERWRNATAGGNNDNHYDFGRPTQQCTNCHSHAGGFSGGGGGCSGCHFGATSRAVQEGRRDVEVDFSRQSHHVQTGGGTGSPGELTDFDCVVCHAEGTVTAGETATTSFHNDSSCNGGRPCIDLKDVDSWDDGDPEGSPVFSYDKQLLSDNVDSIAMWGTSGECTGDDTVECTADADCSGVGTCDFSVDTDWETETADNLDPFCLSCHDTDGAANSYAREDNGSSGFWGSALDPFGDDGFPGDGIVITNTYDTVGLCSVTSTTACDVDGDCPGGETCDLMTRQRVVDINIMVSDTVGRCDASPWNECTTDGDCSGTCTKGDWDGDTRGDPPDGIYARHAIRADSGGTIGAPSRYGANNIPAANWTTPVWNDQAVMGCGDCHTVDGANAENGNAHGSPSEYLLKDAFGKANEGTFSNYNATNQTGGYVCWRCHTQSVYSDANPAHSGSGSNFEDTVAETGAARITAAAKGYGGNFGMACTICHGGAPASEGTFQASTTPEPASKGFGRIHGTSQIFGTGQNGNTSTREAYRFQNGGGLRYYDPNGWSGSSATCYTLNGDSDQWSACEQHNKGTGTSYTREFTRPRDY
jgi:hypothetical protein